ncbi:hypothetical protein BOX15_Mlig026840g2 [Macrostomum lignano]|uniref:Ig-like domain-containing protein n=1 Tax=Macrostomum lignano TaxID=282301 RepID=A0A267FA78_9PLAT|nr:hypothetical protein BOX15_Mlig026840g2 [Macrostomum lignano]
MAPARLLLVLLAVLLAWVQVADCGAAPNYTNIVDRIVFHIFRGYNKHQRPVPASRQKPDGTIEEDSTDVDVNMKILSINKVDVINMEFTLDMYLRQFWKDTRLRWDHYKDFSFYNESIAIPAKKEHLWLPDLFFRNGKEGYLHKMTQPNYLIRVEPDGQILYSQKVTMKFSCQMQLQTFPMDTQTCFVNIGSYGYTTRNLLFKWKRDGLKDPVELDGSMQISEFNAPDFAESHDCTQGSATSTGSYACLKAIFKLERQLGSYLSGTYIPAILIVAVSWLNFWISIEAVPARVSLGLLTLLGILTQGMSVINNLPRTWSNLSKKPKQTTTSVRRRLGSRRRAWTRTSRRRRRRSDCCSYARKPLNSRGRSEICSASVHPRVL